jgi:hypothetical protein
LTLRSDSGTVHRREQKEDVDVLCFSVAPAPPVNLVPTILILSSNRFLCRVSLLLNSFSSEATILLLFGSLTGSFVSITAAPLYHNTSLNLFFVKLAVRSFARCFTFAATWWILRLTGSSLLRIKIILPT